MDLSMSLRLPCKKHFKKLSEILIFNNFNFRTPLFPQRDGNLADLNSKAAIFNHFHVSRHRGVILNSFRIPNLTVFTSKLSRLSRQRVQIFGRSFKLPAHRRANFADINA